MKNENDSKNHKLRLLIDVRPCCDEKLTGIGRTTKEILEAWLKQNKGELDVTAYSILRDKNGEAMLYKNLPFLSPEHMLVKTTESRPKYYFWRLFPTACDSAFRSADLFLSFSYTMPDTVRGKKMLFVYDMVVERFPETMDRRNRIILSHTLQHACRKADCILTISEFSKREICECMHVPEEKVRVIPLAADLQVFHPDYQADEIKQCKQRYGIDQPYFLCAGTIEPRKNTMRLLDAYARLLERLPDAPKLVLTGKKGWLYEDILARMEKEDLHGRVIYTEFVPDTDLALLMAGARAFVFPSLYEGFGLPPLEAMCCGTPVLSSSAASLPEVVGDAGLTVDPLNADEIAAQLLTLAADDALCAKLSRRGLARSRSFSWDRSAAALDEAVKSLFV